MNVKARKGDLVKNRLRTLYIVVSEEPCGDQTCIGEVQCRLVDTPPGTQPLCYQRRDIELVAPAAYLVAEPPLEVGDRIRVTGLPAEKGRLGRVTGIDEKDPCPIDIELDEIPEQRRASARFSVKRDEIERA